VILVTRGHDAAGGKPEEPGALKVFDYEAGLLTNEASVAPNGGYGFGPRHLDFHPIKPWVYVSLERQNRLDMFAFDNGVLSPDRRGRPARFRAQIRCRDRQSADVLDGHGRAIRVADTQGDDIVDGQSETDIGQAIVDKASRVLPGGTFGNFAAEVVIREGKAGRVWGENGKEYIDSLLGSGPMLVGHAHPEVTEAAQAQIARGTTFFANNRLGIELAEAIVEAVPCAEQVRFVSSGTEADLYAMRAARGFTRRDKILKFEGGYHGMSDYSLMSLAPKRSGNFPAPVPDSAGIPKSVRDDMIIAPFNDAEVVEGLVKEHRDELAGVIVEPFQRIIPPAPGFLAKLRKITSDNGVPLIFDEVVTGFRLAYGGAQEYYGVVPDLCTLGKVIGGGFPLAAITG